MSQRTRADSPTKVCTAEPCEKPLRAKGYCAYHYRKLVNPPTKSKAVECPTCGVVTMKREANRRFCSLLCRDLWRIEQPDDPMYRKRATRSILPTDHPVRVLIRANGSMKSPLRLAFEASDWDAVLDAIESDVVKVDGHWLWSRQTKADYPNVNIAGRMLMVHRLSMSALLGEMVPSSSPVHHACAERLCVNPDHLQVVTPIENTAEMMERRTYQARIAELEAALASIAPSHPLIAQPGISPAA